MFALSLVCLLTCYFVSSALLVLLGILFEREKVAERSGFALVSIVCNCDTTNKGNVELPKCSLLNDEMSSRSLSKTNIISLKVAPDEKGDR